jgi:hypothetical protein
MTPASLRTLTAVLVACASACGGEVTGTGADGGSLVPKANGGDGAAPSSDAASATDSPGIDAPTVTSEAGVTCTGGPGGGSGGGGSCQLQVSETCSDGTTYSVSCSCPEATCSCTQTSAQSGSSGGGLPFSGCSDSCGPTSVSLAYQACGFPQ